jgi:hypothetical protein
MCDKKIPSSKSRQIVGLPTQGCKKIDCKIKDGQGRMSHRWGLPVEDEQILEI